MKIEVGQKLYREVFSRNEPPQIKEVTVIKVGRKYFEVEGESVSWRQNKITLENLRYENKEYSQWNYQLYLTKQHILDMQEKRTLEKEIKDVLTSYGSLGITLQQARAIKAILDNK